MTKQNKTLALVQMALFSAIIVTLATTPLGFIPLVVVYATTVHIPVVIGSILFGPRKGAFLGLVFGIASMMKATFSPHLTSFAFSPFYTGGEFLQGGWESIIVSLVPRILVGVLPYYVYQFLRRIKQKEGFSLLIAGVVGSLTNTILVMHFIYLFFAEEYGAVMGFESHAVYGAILLVIATSGVAEAIISGIVVPAVTTVLLKVQPGFKAVATQ
ncbi:MAG: ECF transporter S component [Eubacteriales bacterium]